MAGTSMRSNRSAGSIVPPATWSCCGRLAQSFAWNQNAAAGMNEALAILNRFGIWTIHRRNLGGYPMLKEEVKHRRSAEASAAKQLLSIT